VAIRLALRELRRQEFRLRAERAAFIPEGPGAERDLDVLRAVGALPARQRAAVVLYYFEDRQVADVAEILGCSPQTARVHLFRARQRLGELLPVTEVNP
jgi:RNA polymerase sigma-70 factor (ECF subfamily)